MFTHIEKINDKFNKNVRVVVGKSNNGNKATLFTKKGTFFVEYNNNTELKEKGGEIYVNNYPFSSMV